MRSRLVAAIALLAATAAAQRVVAFDPFAGMLAEDQPPNTILPAPTPPAPVYPAAPLLPPPPLAVPATADATTNTVTGITWYTNGVLLAQMPSPSFPPVGPVMPPFAIAPAVLGMIGGPATGIAIDPIAGILWLTSVPGIVIGVAPVPGTPVLVPPFPIPFPIGPIAGLDWDGISGTLLAVDIGGVVYRFFPTGVPFALPVFPVAAPPFPAGDVAIDKSGAVNGGGLRPIWVSFGPVATDVTIAGPFFPLGVGAAAGLAYLPRPASNPPIGSCPCGAMTPVWGTTGPMTAGNGAFGVSLGGLPPGNLVLFAYDFAFNPLYPLINSSGCPLGLFLGSATMVTVIAFAGATGVATNGLPLFAPPGFGPIYEQSFTLCTADPSGFVVAPLLRLSAGGT